MTTPQVQAQLAQGRAGGAAVHLPAVPGDVPGRPAGPARDPGLPAAGLGGAHGARHGAPGKQASLRLIL